MFKILSPPIHEYYLKLLLNHLSRVQLLVTLWIVSHQIPLSMGFSRQEYWSVCKLTLVKLT